MSASETIQWVIENRRLCQVDRVTWIRTEGKGNELFLEH